MKYLSDLLKISGFVLVMYIPVVIIDYISLVKSTNYEYAATIYERADQIQNEIQNILLKNDILEACQKLDAHISAFNIASYIIIGPETSCYKPSDMNQLPPNIEINSSKIYTVKNNIPLTFYRKKTNQYDWAVSVVTPINRSYWDLFKVGFEHKKILFFDFLLGVYIIVIFFIFAVLILTESIQNTFRTQGKDPWFLRLLNKTFGRFQLHDLKIIKDATAALVKKNIELTEDIDLLETSLEYSVLNEIKKNNHKVPYTFHGTVAKVDINGFSKVVSGGFNNTVRDMTTRLEDYGCELLQRYEGLFEKTIGDEIVVVFKGENSMLSALSFARDLMSEYSKIVFKIDTESRSFTLKSAIYSSDITFLKRPSGYGFSGEAFTYTTRLMDTVQDKHCNNLSIIERQSNQIVNLIQLPVVLQTLTFKNMASQVGYHINAFLPLSDLIKQKSELIEYFKSDADILTLLQNLQKPEDSAHHALYLSALSKINVRLTIPQVPIEWASLVQFAVEKKYDHRVISQIISLGTTLIPKNLWSEELSKTLLQIPRNINGRINATVIEVLMIQAPQDIMSVDQTTFIIPNDSSGRTQGNLIVLNALQKLDNKQFNDLLLMIKSTFPNISKSGIYASCQIIEYYKIKNPAHLETLPGYKSVHEIIKHLRKSENVKFSDRLKKKMMSV